MMNKKIFSMVASILLIASSLPLFAETTVVFIDEQPGIFERRIDKKDLCVSYYARSPFELNVIADSIGLGLSFSGYLAANLTRIFGTYPEYVPGTIYDSSKISPIDKWAMMPYNKTLDTLGTVTEVSSLAIPVITYGMEFLFKNLPLKDGGTLAVMYLESFFTANAIKDAMKISLLRVRPYMYFDNYDAGAIKYHDFEYSMPSGHTMNAFMGATFLTYTFCMYYPQSNWRIPVIATSYAIAVGTGVLRMTSGNHFFTDVLAGAAIGSAVGFLVPFAHTFIAKANAKLADYSERTGNPKIELAALPMGMNVTVKF